MYHTLFPHRRLLRWLLTISLLSSLLPVTQTTQASSDTSTIFASPDAPGPRRANIPYYANGVEDWRKSAILWFGKNDPPRERSGGPPTPGKNYVDVRMAYTTDALEIRFTVVDYYLWYNTDPNNDDDLSQYDAAAIYLDTGHNRSPQPDPNDYVMLMGAHRDENVDPDPNTPEYHRGARGNTSGSWDSWDGDWKDKSGMQWSCNPGPNGNSCGIDYGWYAYFTIPWEVLEESGPPAKGTVWGMGLILYDRDDDPPAGNVTPQMWPAELSNSNPSTWGELHFGDAEYTPSTTRETGSTMIRAESETDNTVEDSWMGGGGWCANDQGATSDVNNGDSTDLFSGSESAPTHFPCYNKSFLRFQLDSVPRDVEIISARLVLHLYGDAGDVGLESDSWIHLFTITDNWGEMTITWNNAPQAQENISATWVELYDKEETVWPGNPYEWDASKAVAEAHTANKPVSLAVYSSDVGRDTTKYFKSSETGDWNIEARPALYVTWGEKIPIDLPYQQYLPLIPQNQ